MKRHARTLPPHVFYINRLSWGLIALVAAVCGAWMVAGGMALDVSKVYPVFGVCAMFASLSLAYRYLRPDDEVYLMGHVANQWIAAGAVLGVFSYVSARLNFPLTDEAMIAIDRMLFFDWRAYVDWVDSDLWLARLLSLAYMSSGPQIILLMALLFLAGKIAHIQKFLLGFFITGLLTIGLAALLPAVGGYVHYDIDLSQYQHLKPVAARVHEAPLLALRDHSLQVVAFPLQGLVTFPSFHSALSVVLIYAAWPVLWLRRICLPLNILVLFSTPADGGHYLIDIIGGLILAAVAIYGIERWIRPPSAGAPSPAATR